MHHVQSWRNVLHDFIGAQYGIPALVQFYRPLITSSFACDGLAGNAAPLVAHLSNVIAHALSALCLAAITARLLGGTVGWASGLVWGLAPCHASSVWWAVGRVDCHTTLWIMLSALCLLQWSQDGRRRRGASLVCFALALASKELSVVVPGIAVVLCAAAAPRGRRLVAALRGVWPFLLVLAGYAALRWWAVGAGGYEGTIDPGAALSGLGWRTCQLLAPMLQGGSRLAAAHGVALPGWVAWLSILPAAAALVAMWKRGRVGATVALAVLFLGCSIPVIQLWGDVSNPKTLRNFYLPMAPLAVLLAAGGWRTAIPALLCFALPWLELRSDYRATWTSCARIHADLLAAARSSAAPLCFAAGLPRENEFATALAFDQGVDRLLATPFTDHPARLFALRPMSQHAAAVRLPYGAARPVPFGVTWACSEGAKPVPSNDAPQPLRCSYRGPPRLTLEVLDGMVRRFKERDNDPAAGPAILVEGPRAAVYRVTVFSAGGYTSAMVADAAPSGAAVGVIPLGALLVAPAAPGLPVALPLRVASALDLDNRFPVLVEADTRPQFSGQPSDFHPTHANTLPLWIELDRRFAAWWKL
ncbi:MAG: hypothetical protein KDC87_03750 [Planctomycetes bacterium]|nr:hypothetical protein [Planctomycetota bacterium]